MNKIIRYTFLVLVIISAIYFDNILKYVGSKYNNQLIYNNYKVNIPKNFALESITHNNNVYLYGLIKSKLDKTKDPKEKKYIFIYEKNWFTIFINNDKKLDIDNLKIDYEISKNTNLFEDLKNNSMILKYKNTYIKYNKLNNIRFFYIFKNDIYFLLLLNKIENKKSFNKHILELIDNINKN